MERRKYLKAGVNLLTALVILLLVIFLLPKVISFFMPFIVGWIIAMIANPLVRMFEKRIKIKRKAGSVIVIVAVIALVVLLVYLVIANLFTEAVSMLSELPEAWTSFSATLNNWGTKLEALYQRVPSSIQENIDDVLENLDTYISQFVNTISEPTFEVVGNIAKSIPSVIVGVFMWLLSSYFFVARREEINDFMARHIPLGLQKKWEILYKSLMGAVGGYFIAQARIEAVIYVVLFIGLLLLKVKYSFLIAFLIAALDFLPVFGAGAVLWPWALVCLLNGEYFMALALMVLWSLAQVVRQLIQPKFVGDSIGLAPIPTLFLLYIGYKVGGVVGMILAVPIGIVVIRMYEAGMFQTTVDSAYLLLDGFNRFRRLEPEDLAEVNETRKREQTERERMMKEREEAEDRAKAEKEQRRQDRKRMREEKKAHRKGRSE